MGDIMTEPINNNLNKGEKEKNDKIMELYAQAQVLQQQLINIEEQIKQLDVQEAELNLAIESIQELNKIKDEEESLVPIVNGVFVKAKLKKPDELIVNVGSNVLVKKSVDETKELIRQNISEIRNYKEKLSKQHENIIRVLEQTQKEMQNIR